VVRWWIWKNEPKSDSSDGWSLCFLFLRNEAKLRMFIFNCQGSEPRFHEPARFGRKGAIRGKEDADRVQPPELSSG